MKILINYILIAVSIFFISCNIETKDTKSDDNMEVTNEQTDNDEEVADFIEESYSRSMKIQRYNEVMIGQSNLDDSITTFAQASLKYHRNLNLQLAELVKNTEINMPIEKDTAFVEEFRSMEDAELLDEYKDEVIDIQGEMIAYYKSQITDTEHSEVLKLIEVVLPTLEDQQTYAKGLITTEE